MTLATLGFDMKRRWRKGDFAAPVPEGSVNREAVQEYSLGFQPQESSGSEDV